MFILTPLIAFMFGIAAGGVLLVLGIVVYLWIFNTDGLDDFER